MTIVGIIMIAILFIPALVITGRDILKGARK